MKKPAIFTFILIFLSTLILFSKFSFFGVNYKVVDTGEDFCCSDTAIIPPPQPGQSYYGQDAQFTGNQPSYVNNNDGTITDLNTGLMWVRARGNKTTWDSTFIKAAACRVGGYSDWRVPTIKELYSLINYKGRVGPSPDSSTPYIDTNYFQFRYGFLNVERIIDCQDWSATKYVGLTMIGDTTIFGVNFADGRIKGYPKYFPPQTNYFDTLYVRFVRGNLNYGINHFINNGDGTVTDTSTGLIWQKADDGRGRIWKDALKYADTLTLAGYTDWRLPNAKELQSIVDYTHAPDATDPSKRGPAIDTNFFKLTPRWDGEYAYYWTGTTHMDGTPDSLFRKAVYICFGRALGWMQVPPNFDWQLLDVHGAGAQRSDPKKGDTTAFPHGWGPQGDVIRIYNNVLCVRNGSSIGIKKVGESIPLSFVLYQNYPNPFNPTTKIKYDLPFTKGVGVMDVKLVVYDILGKEVATLVNEKLQAGSYVVFWNASNFSSGIYFYKLMISDPETSSGLYFTQTNKMILLK